MSFILVFVTFVVICQFCTKGQDPLTTDKYVMRWPDCTLRYRFTEEYDWSSSTTKIFGKIVGYIEDRTYVRFVNYRRWERTPYVKINNGTQNEYALGYAYKPYSVGIYSEGTSEYAIFRLILRLLGFLDEVNRRDRDPYFDVQKEFLQQTPECIEYIKKYINYPPVKIPFTFRTIMYRGTSYCGVGPNGPLWYKDTKNYRLFGDLESPHGENLTDEEYEREWARIEAFYPYNNCSESTLD